MRIGILYICTGRYDVFWKKFYLSAEQNLMQGIPCTREYFVFTDAPFIYGEEDNPRIHRIYQKSLGWPDNTLRRFQMFLKIEKELREKTDYLYFFNANMVIVKPIGIAFLPVGAHNGLVGVLHPDYYNKTNREFPYERRPDSIACIPEGTGLHYYMGSLSGGVTEAYLKLSHTINQWIKQDDNKGVVAIWHDESMLNRYFLEYPPCVVLDPSYCCMVGETLSYEPVILLRDKDCWEYGGCAYMRKSRIKEPFKLRIKKRILHIIRGSSVHVYLKGGLGNQLFQYALYLTLKKQMPNTKIEMVYREREVSNHNGIELLDDFVDLPALGGIHTMNNSIRDHSAISLPLNGNSLRYTKYGSLKDLQGYWQHLYNVHSVKDELRINLFFKPFQDEKNQKMSEFIRRTNETVAVHVRRGDYLNYTDVYRNLCETTYYVEAIDRMQKHFKDPFFVIFSNDIPWCKENLQLPKDRFCFVDWNTGKESFRDMQLMSLCKHAIIANSTFSWWGAWLNNNPDKMVIAPNKWFVAWDTAEGIGIPDNWIRI